MVFEEAILASIADDLGLENKMMWLFAWLVIISLLALIEFLGSIQSIGWKQRRILYIFFVYIFSVLCL